MIRRVAFVCFLAASVLAPTHGRAVDEPIQLHVITSLTGLGAFLGKQDLVSIQIGEKLLNKGGGIQGRPVKFNFYDDQSNPQVAVQLTKQVIATKPSVILGAHIVAMCNAMAPLVRNGPVQYCFSPAIHPAPGSYTFSSTVATQDAVRAQLRYFRAKGITRLALLASTDASGEDGERILDEELKLPENKDFNLLDRAHFNTSDVSVSAQLERLKAAQPQAFFAWTVGTPLGTVFKGLIQAGINSPIVISYGNQTYAQMEQYADFTPKQLYVPSSAWPPHPERLSLAPAVEAVQKNFYAAFKAAGLTPDVGATASWDPMMIVVDALRKLGPDATAEQLHDYLSHLKGYAGINGIYDFEKVPQRGLSDENAVVTLWNAGTKTWDVVSKPGGTPLD
ncbi:MAG: ABC transporter substrate-binding protein [Xanthobacteraceae bacterium]|jgi:branched-chain amino acid transport system substrate-binding protein